MLEITISRKRSLPTKRIVIPFWGPISRTKQAFSDFNFHQNLLSSHLEVELIYVARLK